MPFHCPSQAFSELTDKKRSPLYPSLCPPRYQFRSMAKEPAWLPTRLAGQLPQSDASLCRLVSPRGLAQESHLAQTLHVPTDVHTHVSCVPCPSLWRLSLGTG